MNPKHDCHAVYVLNVHLIFVCKRRAKVFERRHLDRLREILSKVRDDFETDLMAFNGEHEHVRLWVSHPPKVSVSSLIITCPERAALV